MYNVGEELSKIQDTNYTKNISKYEDCVTM